MKRRSEIQSTGQVKVSIIVESPKIRVAVRILWYRPKLKLFEMVEAIKKRANWENWIWLALLFLIRLILLLICHWPDMSNPTIS